MTAMFDTTLTGPPIDDLSQYTFRYGFSTDPASPEATFCRCASCPDHPAAVGLIRTSNHWSDPSFVQFFLFVHAFDTAAFTEIPAHEDVPALKLPIPEAYTFSGV